MFKIKSEVLAFVTPLLAIIAWILALVASFFCYNTSIDVTLNDRNYSLDFGLWNYQGWSYLVDSGTIYYAETCFGYDDVSFDAKWKTARAFSIIAIVLGGILMIFNCAAGCSVNPMFGYQVMTGLYFFCALSQGLTLLFLDSNACKNNPLLSAEDNIQDVQIDASCNRSWGANCSIAAVVIWFLTGVCLCALGKRGGMDDDDDVYDDAEEQAVEEVE